MADTAWLTVLRVPPSPINLSDVHDFQQEPVRGFSFSLAVDADARARINAAKEVGELGRVASSAVPYLIEMLGQDRTTAVPGDVVARIASGSGTRDDGQKAENMTRFAEADAACHMAAVDSLAQIGSSAIPALIAALRSPASNCRNGASKALGKIGVSAASALPILNDLAKTDPAETVRKAATEAAKLVKPRRWFSF